MSQIISGIRNNLKYWWLYLLNGIIFLIAGGIVFSNPFSSYVLLSIFIFAFRVKTFKKAHHL